MGIELVFHLCTLFECQTKVQTLCEKKAVCFTLVVVVGGGRDTTLLHLLNLYIFFMEQHGGQRKSVSLMNIYPHPTLILIHTLLYDPLHCFRASERVLKTDSLHINYAWVSPAEEQVSFHLWLFLNTESSRTKLQAAEVCSSTQGECCLNHKYDNLIR